MQLFCHSMLGTKRRGDEDYLNNKVFNNNPIEQTNANTGDQTQDDKKQRTKNQGRTQDL